MKSSVDKKAVHIIFSNIINCSHISSRYVLGFKDIYTFYNSFDLIKVGILNFETEYG